MTLGRKLGLLFVALFLGLFALEVVVQRLVLRPSFEALEREQATRNVQRAVDALRREVELLAPLATDWATWDDMYAFLVDRHDDFRRSNLNPTALAAAHVDLLAIFAADGTRAWALGWDAESEAARDLGPLTGPALPAEHPLRRGEGGCTAAGLLDTPDGPFLVAARPVLTSEGEGPPRGCVVMGRRLDAAAVARLAAQASVALSVARLPAAPAAAAGADPPDGITLEEADDTLRGHTSVADLAGRPLLRLSVDTPRRVLAHGDAALRFASLSLAGAGVLVLALLLIVLRRTVVGPLARLTAHVAAIGRDGDVSRRLDLQRRDEIGALAGAFDRMVEQLADARQRLLEQSFRSGMAELASGVLHNIGNAVTPIGVKLAGLKDAVAAAPLAELEQAAAELSDPATPPERRAALGQFVELAAQELAAVVRRTAEGVDAIAAKTTYVQEILAEQGRFARAPAVVEPVALGPVVARAVRLLPEELQQTLAVEADPDLDDAGRVAAAPVALQQVVSNLLINAAEAVLTRGPGEPPGRVHVSAAPARLEDRPALAVRFVDNGAGIAPDVLPRLFERGFSTKGRGSGMGLHWCANTVAALGGRLTAESEGTGRGACLHLVLPLASPPPERQENAA